MSEGLHHATDTSTERKDYDYKVLIERSGATLSLKLTLVKYTAVDEAKA